jgi:hypothetical protein
MLLVRFQALTAANMKMAVFWVVVPCSVVQVCRRFRGMSYLLLTRRRDNLKSHLFNLMLVIADTNLLHPLCAAVFIHGLKRSEYEADPFIFI